MIEVVESERIIRFAASLQIEKARNADEAACRPALCAYIFNMDDAINAVRQRPQQRGVHESKNRGGRSEAEGQRPYGHHRERLLFCELPDRIYDIALAMIQPE